jgi:hypothetical protein
MMGWMELSVRERPELLRPGALIHGRFIVLAVLGKGGVGTVYRVRDRQSGAEVALKQLHATGDDPAPLLAAFQREYHTLCQLAHPSIIEVHDYGVDGQTAYYTMELLDGQDLLERGKMPWPEACAVLRDVASSLAILHSRRWLHRDVSLRNVRCTQSGRAKLLDFGAMVPFGIVKSVMGTPPFVPPEALQLQALDGRSDLYGLGVLAYYLLTGRYPYPARDLAQLPLAWSSLPAPPRRHDAQIPPALDELVMQLLQLDRDSRPSSAAEVMERVCGVAGLLLCELPEVSRAYLLAPGMVDRESALGEARRLLARSRQGRGGSLWIEGVEGAGRSRLLSACVLEAKLLGMVVLRGDAADGAAGPYGLAKQICGQLLLALPGRAVRQARPWRSILAHLVPSLQPPDEEPCVGPQRRHLQSALCNWLLSVARRTPIAIAVDDVDEVDEPSIALLAALSHGALRRRLTLLVSAARGTHTDPGLSLLRKLAFPVALEPLDLTQVGALLRSVFGDAEHVVGLAEQLHRLCAGNPGQIMTICEQLVEHGVARYEAGRWSLRRLAPAELPQSVAAVRSARLAGLPEDARALAEALALTNPLALPVEEYLVLTEHKSPERLYPALDALVAASVLAREGDRYRFQQHELSRYLSSQLDPARSRELHARLAHAVQNSVDPLLLPHHLLLGGREHEGLECLHLLRDHPRMPSSPAVLALLELAVQCAERLASPPAIQLELQVWLVAVAADLGHYECFHRYAFRALDALEQSSGLSDYRELHALGDTPARLAEAQRRVHARHQALSSRERGPSPGDSLAELGQLCSTVAALAGIAADLPLIERLPSLEPLFDCSPGLRVVALYIDCMRSMLSSRFERCYQRTEQIIAILDRPESHDLGPAHAKRFRLDCLFIQGILGAGIGRERARACVAELEQEPGFRSLAWNVRMVYELARGHALAAAQCKRRSELLRLQDGGTAILPGTTAAIELQIAQQGDDLIGVKRSREQIEVLAAAFPGWRPYLDVATSYYRRLQGDLAGALASLGPWLGDEPPGRHHTWTLARSAEIELRTALGDAAAAAERGLSLLELARRHELGFAISGLSKVTAEALAACGRGDEAVRLADAHLAGLLRAGTSGLLLANAYETRARVAIAMRDEPALRHFAELAAQAYRPGKHPGANAKWQRLLREASAAGVVSTSDPSGGDELGAARLVSVGTDLLSTAPSRLLGCVGHAERSREALRLLLDMTGASAGYLYAVHTDWLEPVAVIDEGTRFHDLGELLREHLLEQLALEAQVTVLAEFESPADRSGRDFLDQSARSFEPMLLFAKRAARGQLAGVAALHYGSAVRGSLRQGVLAAVADSLVETGPASSPAAEPEAARDDSA